MVAILRPDLFGPCLVAGSPMSYWQGVHGKNPMRYAGGLLGGSWLIAMTSDLGNGKIDGTGFDPELRHSEPANWLWGKQYEVYTHIDTDAARYLKFEKWWGDFIQLNGDELRFLVDDLFIGDKLTRNQIESRNGAIFDYARYFADHRVTSMADNISPPADARLDPRSLSGRRRHPRHRPERSSIRKPRRSDVSPSSSPARSAEGGRGVRATDGRHRLLSASSL